VNTVWKFPLPRPGQTATIALPPDAQIVHFGAQQDQLCMWALLDPSAERAPRRFIALGTGWDAPSHLRHLLTHQGAVFVWHLFEEPQ
jgi:hypothetical protein